MRKDYSFIRYKKYMPMKNLSTQCMDNKSNKEQRGYDKQTSPRKQTLDFLSQFARVYCSEKTLNAGHCGLVLN